MRAEMDQTWVVYSMPLKNCPDPMRAVCEQREWEAMDRAKPGFYTLIQSGIENEGEAERLARRIGRSTSPQHQAAPFALGRAKPPWPRSPRTRRSKDNATQQFQSAQPLL